MPQKNIYVSDEVYNKLKNVENVSGLVNNLLYDYFNSKNIIKEPTIEMIEEKEIEIEKIEREKREMEEILTIKAQSEEEENIKKIEINKEKGEFIRIIFKELCDRDMTNDEIEEYFILKRDGMIEDLGQYIKLKGLNVKEEVIND